MPRTQLLPFRMWHPEFGFTQSGRAFMMSQADADKHNEALPKWSQSRWKQTEATSYTNRQKREIRGHYAHLKLRFLRDGTVDAQKVKGGAWGVLYHPNDAQRHLQAKGLL